MQPIFLPRPPPLSYPSLTPPSTLHPTSYIALHSPPDMLYCVCLFSVCIPMGVYESLFVCVSECVSVIVCVNGCECKPVIVGVVVCICECGCVHVCVWCVCLREFNNVWKWVYESIIVLACNFFILFSMFISFRFIVKKILCFWNHELYTSFCFWRKVSLS